MGFNEEFSTWLLQQMDSRGWNQTDLAREAHVARQTINGILGSRRTPGVVTCNNLAMAFKLPYAEVYRAAGIIPEKTDSSIADEVDFKVRMLSRQKQQTVLDLINGLLIREEREDRG